MSEAKRLGLQIKEITPLCQLQDGGRFGYKNYGVTHSGAIDPYSLRVANLLVGNKQDAACLEFTLIGAEFVVTSKSMRIAFAGDFPVSVNGQARSNYCSLVLVEGDTLRIGTADKGIRGYLAVAGGFLGKKELGSYSSHVRSGLGGFHSPMLAGTTLAVANLFALSGKEYFLREKRRRVHTGPLRVVAGPQTEHFTKRGIEQFYASSFAVSNDSDRMGYRLENNPIEHAGDGNIISDPTVPGSIQVPASGDPVVLMADCPTTGGYPKIATIISVDLGVLAQKGPGSVVCFEEITVERAQSLVKEQEAYFAALNLEFDRS